MLTGKESEMNRTMLVVLTAVAAALASNVATADGKAVWDKSCAGCHKVLAPKTGDKAAWAPLIKKGAAELTAVVIKGKAPMPPKGGAASDADVKAAVEYIISQMQ
jgi:nitrite reductase (NO-forming)